MKERNPVKDRFVELLNVDMSGCEGDWAEEMAEYLLHNGARVPIAREKADLELVDLSLFDNGSFTLTQLEEIRKGLEHGLSRNMVLAYAKPEYVDYQMREIRIGIENGLLPEEVGVYAKPEFNEWQMNVIRVGLELGQSLEEVSVYAKPGLTWQQMFKIRNQQRNGEKVFLPIDEVINNAAKLKVDDKGKEFKNNERSHEEYVSR